MLFGGMAVEAFDNFRALGSVIGNEKAHEKFYGSQSCKVCHFVWKLTQATKRSPQNS